MDNGLTQVLEKSGLSAWWAGHKLNEELTSLPKRLRTEFFKATRAIESDAPKLASIDNLIIEGAETPLNARLYTPLAAGIGQQPALLFFHGGGFVLGDLESYEMICTRLAHAAKLRVLSVEYRLAPEHKFPAAHKDAFAAFDWLRKNGTELNIDPNRIAIGGDSAGGNLSAFLAQECLRREIPAPVFQLLLYPLMQFANIKDMGLTFQEGFFISPALFDVFKNAYLTKNDDPMDVRISPLFAKPETLGGLPPAHIVVCGWDPLNAEGKAYGDMLAAAGVPVTLEEHPDMVHGFMNLTAVSKPAREALHNSGQRLGRFFGTTPQVKL